MDTTGGSRTTVVVATRNRADELVTTLDRLADADPQPPVVVVDNASDDHTVRAAAGFRGRIRALEVLALPRNHGAVARNHGARRATTPFVAFCDDDAWWAPGALRTAEDLFDRHPEVGLIAARTLVGPERRDDPVNHLMLDSPLGTDPRAPGPSVLGFLAGASVVRREPFLAAGGFSPVLHFAGEETLLAYDLAAAGWLLCYSHEVVSRHMPSLRRLPSTARRDLELRNSVLTTLMRRPVGACVRELAAMGGTVLRHPSRAPVLFGVAARLPRALRARRRLPDHVEDRIALLRAGKETS
ncbi:glycosyltransferase family 2 protein [Nocardia blacklockiae]|uniref:glycosyltransferase family 2 protein n=1 Tax=Nocardia blacklockiae TaxID=480036 RepID=UPI001895AA62|nr:glycosyltransferase family 2 protein [Nocardia blacklockiae]MBF6175321.1 glycosyltransferase family 2 protein [Nocardia blacklockiae]